MADPKSPDAATREDAWARAMRAGLAGDSAAYRGLLEAITPHLRALVRRQLARAGNADAEDVVQEVLLAIHLKRHTWMTDQPFTPWLNAIARHKVIDALRKRGRRSESPIEGLEEILPAPTEDEGTSHSRTRTSRRPARRPRARHCLGDFAGGKIDRRCCEESSDERRRGACRTASRPQEACCALSGAGVMKTDDLIAPSLPIRRSRCRCAAHSCSRWPAARSQPLPSGG